jgi:ferredoxin
MPQLKYLPNVSTLKLDVEKCNGCGMCVIVCPHAVFAIEERLARITDIDSCMECGACAGNCPEEAIYRARLRLRYRRGDREPGLAVLLRIGDRCRLGIYPPTCGAQKSHKI